MIQIRKFGDGGVPKFQTPARPLVLDPSKVRHNEAVMDNNYYKAKAKYEWENGNYWEAAKNAWNGWITLQDEGIPSGNGYSFPITGDAPGVGLGAAAGAAKAVRTASKAAKTGSRAGKAAKTASTATRTAKVSSAADARQQAKAQEILKNLDEATRRNFEIFVRNGNGDINNLTWSEIAELQRLASGNYIQSRIIPSFGSDTPLGLRSDVRAFSTSKSWGE